ncbi:MAG: NYN domain-containing protein [Patescibacteria group bacterium]|nr:NYN domain-containing protein [Patescibacteria group bacterium]
MENNLTRVGIFVDVQNLYYSARNLYKSYVNFSKIRALAGNHGKIVRSIAYGIKADINKEENFFDALKDAGFEVKLKDLQIFPGGMKKGDWDVGMTVDMIRMAPKLDIVVLVSGDGDFADLIEYLQNLGVFVIVMSFGPSSSSRLVEKADALIDMDKDKNFFLLKKIRTK